MFEDYVSMKIISRPRSNDTRKDNKEIQGKAVFFAFMLPS